MHLDQFSIPERPVDGRIVGREPERHQLAQGHQFVGVDIRTLVLGKTEQEDRAIGAKAEQQAKAAPPPLARSRHALLDDPAAEIGIDQTTPCARNGLDETGVIDAVLPGETREILRLEDTHASSMVG